MSEYLLILGLMALSYLGHNMSVFFAALILLILKPLVPLNALQYIGSHGINWGVIVLTVAMLVPIATGEMGAKDIINVFKSPEAIAIVLAGVAVAIFAREGISFIKEDPTVVVALMLGTILGVFFFKGIPVGPLIAGGIVYCALKALHWFFALFH